MDVPSSGAEDQPEFDPSLSEAEAVKLAPAPNRSRGVQGVAKAGVFMIIAALLSRILGMGREVVIAAQLGQGNMADVYKQAFMVPDLLFVLLSSGALASVFVPVFTEYLENDDKDRAWYFFSNAATIIGIGISAFVVLGEIFCVPLTKIVCGGFTADKVLKTAALTRIVLPAQFCFFVGSILISVQYAFKRFKVPAMGSIVYNAFIIAGGLALAKANFLTRAIGLPNGIGPAGFSWGALIGAIMGNLVIQAFAVKKLGGRYRFILDWKDPGVHTFARLMIPIIFTLSLPQLDMQVNKYFATYLKDGSVASLDYANRLMQLPLGILAQASAIAIFPFISGQAARQDMVALRHSLNLAVRTITAMTMPAAVLMVALAEPIVRLIYQHGKFGADDTAFTAIVLVCYAVGIAAWSAQTVLARGFYALKDTWTPMSTGTVVTFIFVLMNLAVVKPFADKGLAASTSIAAALLAGALFFRLQKRLGGLNGKLIMVSFAKVSLAAAIMAVPVYALRRAMTPWLGGFGMVTNIARKALSSGAIDHITSTTQLSTTATMVLLAACMIVGLAIYAALLSLFKVDEAAVIFRKLSERLGRGRGVAAVA